MQFCGRASGAPARPEAGTSGFEEVVDVFQLVRHEYVIVAEFEELRVGVLQELNGGLGSGLRVVDEGGIPSDNGEVAWIVRDARRENFLAFAFGERGGFSADDLRDRVRLRGEKLFRGRTAVDLADVEDEVILLQPVLFVIGLDKRGCGALQALPDYAVGQ